MRVLRGLLALGVLASLVLAAAPGPAGAQVATLAEGKSLCDAAIAKRLTDLASVKTLLGGASHVTEPDRTSLDAQLDAATAGLTGLKATIDADTTLRQLRIDCRMIVTSYRVYLVLIPKVHLVVAADRVDAAVDVLSRLAALLQARPGETPNPTLTDLANKVGAAEQAASGIPIALLPLQASGYPANRPALASARASLAAAQADLTAALADARLLAR